MEISDESIIRKLVEFESVEEYEEEMERIRNRTLSSVDLNVLEKAFHYGNFERIGTPETNMVGGVASVVFEDIGEVKLVVVSKESENGGFVRIRLPENPMVLGDCVEHLEGHAEFLLNDVEPDEVPMYYAQLFPNFNPDDWNQFVKYNGMD